MVEVSELRREVVYALKESGISEGAQKLREFGDENVRAAGKAEILVRQQRLQEDSIQRVASRLDAYARSLDPVYRAQQQVERGERLVAAAQARGIEVSSAAAKGLDLARERYKALSDGMNDNAKQAGLNRYEWINLSRQAQDLVVSLAGGQKPLTVLLQQGTQVADIFTSHRGGAGAALSSFTATIGGMINPTVLAAAAIVALGAAAIAAGSSLADKLEKIADASKKTGVSSDFFQAWTKQAVALKVEVEDLEEALVNARRTMMDIVENGEVKLGAGGKFLSGLESAGKISRGDLAAYLNADTADAKLTVVLETMRKLLRAGHEVEALRLGETFFGTTELAEKLARALEAGKMNMTDLLSSARGAGAILDAELVKRAGDLDQRLRDAKIAMEDGLKPILKDLAKLGLDIKGGWVSTNEALASATKLAGRLYEHMKPIGDLLDKIAIVRGVYTRLFATELPRIASGVDPFTEDAYSKLPQMRNIAAENGGRSRPTGNDEVEAAIKANKAAAKHFLESMDAEKKKNGGGSSKSESLDEVERYIQSLEKQNAALEGEAAAIGKSAVEREKSIDLAKAEEAAKERGTALTDEERVKVLQLAEAHVTLREKIDDANKAKQGVHAAEKFFANTVESGIEKLIVDHEKFRDVLRDIVKEYERAMLKGLLLGEGPLGHLLGGGPGKDGAPGGLFGSIIGGIGSLFKFADGGMVTLAHLPRYAGGGALAPDGGFPVIAHPGEIILNMAQQRNVAEQIAGRRGGDGMSVTVVNNAGRQVKATPSLTAGELVLTIDSRVDRRLDSLKDNILDIIDDRQKRR